MKVLAIFPLKAVGKVRMVRSDSYKKRKVVLDYWNMKDIIKIYAKKQNFILPETFHYINLKKMPASWSKKKKIEMLHKPCDQKPDVDNSVGSIMDFLSNEDKYIYDIRSSKYWHTDDMLVILELPLFDINKLISTI